MKRYFLFLIIIFTLFSCSKYEDGVFSLKTTENRLEGDIWYSDMILYKNKEYDIKNKYDIKFLNFKKAEGFFQLNVDTTLYVGEVRLEENKTRLVFFEINEYSNLDTITNTVFNSWRINKLSNNELKIETNIENIDVEIKFYRK